MSELRFVDELIRLLAPVKCLGCGEITLEKAPLCRKCMGEFIKLVAEKCPVCGMDKDECVCPGAKSVRFLFYYDSEFSRHIIRALKYHITSFKADYIANLLYMKLPQKVDFDAVVYPPRSDKNKRKYDFDQAEMLSKALAGKLGIPCIKAIKRSKSRKEQKLLSAEQRFKNVKGAFEVDAAELSGMKRVILLDDVMTTGATLNECTRLLKRAGIAKIFAITVARTPKSRRTSFNRDFKLKQ